MLAIVDPDAAGNDAGELLDGVHRSIPILASLQDAIDHCGRVPEFCVVGIATHGGKFTEEIRAGLLEAVGNGMSIVNGLHDVASEDPEIGPAAVARGVEVIDLRKPKPKSELHFWEGDIADVRAPRIAVLGTDCALGKRTTTRELVLALARDGVKAEMIYTGQTGWMQGATYGFVLDATLNDYVSGELEHAIVACDREVAPDVMLIEGQSSLRNPSGPCGSEFLLSGYARAVVLHHGAGREYFEGYESQGLRIPPLEDEIELIKLYGAVTIAVTLNGTGMDNESLVRYQREKEKALGIPVVRVLDEGFGRLVPVVRDYLSAHEDAA